MNHPNLCAAALAAALLCPLSLRAQSATPAWSSGFETGFPGEFLDYGNGYSASGTGSGSASSWTIIEDPADGPIFSGGAGYRGRIVASSGELHRAYPVLHTEVPSPYVNSWMVYLDVDYASLTSSDWISVGTWAHQDVGGVWSELATVSVRDRRLEMAHANWSYVGPTPQPEFPTRKWVRLTTYVDRSSGNELAVWQDGVLVFRGSFPEPIRGTALLRAHWGLYGTGSISAATLYNDAIQLWTLSGPSSDFGEEPSPPHGPDGGFGDGGAGSPDAGVGPDADAGLHLDEADDGGLAGGSEGSGGLGACTAGGRVQPSSQGAAGPVLVLCALLALLARRRGRLVR